MIAMVKKINRLKEKMIMMIMMKMMNRVKKKMILWRKGLCYVCVNDIINSSWFSFFC